VVLALLLAGLSACAEESPSTVPPDGAALYSSTCAACHGIQGIGDSAAAMTDDVVTTLSDAEIATIVRNGKNTMPGFPTLNDAEVAAIVDYVRSLDIGG
jgi:mono/diheme cytochrome c family protein